MLDAAAALLVVKAIHTVVWAFFASCIFAIPVLAWRHDFGLAFILIAVVLVEVFVLIANGWNCPLSGVAARYTKDRRDSFDIYLPLWLARHNKTIFGWLFTAGALFTLVRWWAA
jgi:hypothetical protein